MPVKGKHRRFPSSSSSRTAESSGVGGRFVPSASRLKRSRVALDHLLGCLDESRLVTIDRRNVETAAPMFRVWGSGCSLGRRCPDHHSARSTRRMICLGRVSWRPERKTNELVLTARGRAVLAVLLSHAGIKFAPLH